MTPENFCYWLQGKLEIVDGKIPSLSKKEVQIIKDHLDLVFTKKTPNRNESSDKDSTTDIFDEIIKERDKERPHIIPLTPYNPWKYPDNGSWPPYKPYPEIICSNGTDNTTFKDLHTSTDTACQEVYCKSESIQKDATPKSTE